MKAISSYKDSGGSSSRPASGRHRSLSGFSLVEMGIALAVVGLIMGGSAVAIGNKYRNEIYQRADAQMGDIVDAIVGYAISNRTNGMLLIYGNSENGGVPTATPGSNPLGWFGYRLVKVAANRPYLPCPDTDGDGIEDRNDYVVRPIVQPGLSNAFNRTPVDAGGGNTALRDNRFVYLDASDTDANHTRALFATTRTLIGTCSSQTGGLPYKTLGLKRGDPWGGVHTYIVNQAFSMGAYGFDQHTRTRSYRQMIDMNFHLAGTSSSPSVLRHPQVVIPPAGPAERPLIACRLKVVDYTNDRGCGQDFSNYSTGGSTGILPKGHDTGTASMFSINSTGSPAGHIGGGFESGRQARDMMFFDRFAVGQIVNDGLPFAVISHGMDREGRVDDRLFASSFFQECAIPDTAAERVNSRFQSCLNSDLPQAGSVTSAKISQLSDFDFVSAGGYRYLSHWFYSHGRAATSSTDTHLAGGPLQMQDGVFDDIATWLTRRELSERMRRAGVFPLEDHELFPGHLRMLAFYDPSPI